MGVQHITVKWNRGGAMGPNATLLIDGKPFGIFYNEGGRDIDGREVLEMLVEAFNANQQEVF